MEAFFASFGLITIAEMGDKSQLVALAFATRYRAWQVLAGITAATLLVHAGSVLIGRIAGDQLPEMTIAVITGVAFLGFGAWTLRGDSISGDDTRSRGMFGAFLIVSVAFFIAELGDKTMLATITVASQYPGFLGTWLGSTAGMVVADAAAIAVGVILGSRLPEKPIKLVAAAIFLIFGVRLISDAII
ncbi:MAG: TMEM165/GDT1 family protein [Proteobacteria bacterium]|nr:TMEM165/GDT1 family protein [Pseudomonadota bacterium]